MVEDLGAEFVAEDGVRRGVEAVVQAAAAPAQVDQVFHVVQGVQVRAADPAGQGLDQYLACARDQLGDLIADQALVAPDDGSHSHTPEVCRSCPDRFYPLTLAPWNQQGA